MFNVLLDMWIIILQNVLMRGKFILLVLVVFLFWGNLFNTHAQDDTFGPICEGTTTTCTPSPTATSEITSPPLPTSTPEVTTLPTETPLPTAPPGLGGPEVQPTPTEMPRAGSVEVVSMFLLSSVILISLGLLGRLLLVKY